MSVLYNIYCNDVVSRYVRFDYIKMLNIIYLHIMHRNH